MTFEPCFPLSDSPPGHDGVRVERDVPVPMRDGVRLAADLYFPAEPGPHPVLLERTPYGKHSSVMVRIDAPQALARSGYVVAIQDVRGRYASEGAWYPFADDLGAQHRDGWDSVEWLAAQPFCTGKVGAFGGSYAGFNQYTLAAGMPPHLAAAFPRQAPQCLHSEWVYRGGALEFAFIVPRFARHMSGEALRNRQVQFVRKFHDYQLDLEKRWPLQDHYLLSDPFQWLRDYTSRQEDAAYWAQWDIGPYQANFDVPAYHVTSWFDIFLGGTLRNFRGMPRRNHKLIIGPWIHGAFMAHSPQGRFAGEMDCGEGARWDYTGAMRRWFDCWLKGLDDGITSEPDVRYFVMGSNQWKIAADWPPPGVEYHRLYFGEGGGLGREPAPGNHATAFLHDPDDPAPSCGGNTLFNLSPRESTGAEVWEDLNEQAGSRDQRAIEPRAITFTSAPLERDLEIAGPVEAVVYLSSRAVDTDVVVRLCDVYPDGRSMLLCDGIQRTRYRESPFRSALLEPGRVYEIHVDLWATANRFAAGHRIRVVVNSSCYPRFDVNPGTGESMLCSSTRVKAENHVHMGPLSPSCILLPVSSER